MKINIALGFASCNINFQSEHKFHIPRNQHVIITLLYDHCEYPTSLGQEKMWKYFLIKNLILLVSDAEVL